MTRWTPSGGRARRELAYAVRSYDPALEPLHPGDVTTVPISSYPTVVREAKRLADEYDLLVPCFGHAGDGNLHYSVLVDPDSAEQVERGEECYREIVELAIELGGTATGEHGIGQGKREYLEPEHGGGAGRGHADDQASARSDRHAQSGKDIPQKRPPANGSTVGTDSATASLSGDLAVDRNHDIRSSASPLLSAGRTI